ncbi:hypothetical protein ONS96_014166 [Cadophora gregata f. sp. sojae]|nr:hypothetical protein ONS96_014166 [Cadophora gregata f. sp. sojae]
MTEGQLALEREDPTAVIPWPKHWKRVSIRLQENGYNRTPNACAAYWLKVGYDFSVDNYEPVPEMSRFRKTDNAKNEVEVEVEIEVEDEDEDEGVMGLGTEPDEQVSRPNQVSVDDSVSSYSRDGEVLPEVLPEPRTILLSNATSIFTPSITPAPSEKDPSEDESYQPRQHAPTKSKMSQTPTRPEATTPKARSPKLPMRRGFRFTAEQRAVLEAQVANHGPYPDSDRRAELACDLGVEEKTIRNWFIHRRSQNGQSIFSGMNTPGSNNHKDSLMSESSTPASVPPDSGFKRRPFNVDYNDTSLSTGEDIGLHHMKRPRLGDDHNHGYNEGPQINNHTVHSNKVTEDLGTQRGFGMRQSSGSSISFDPSHSSSMAGSLIGRESAATSTSSFSPVNLAIARHHPTGDLPIQTLRHDRQEENRPEVKKSPSIPTPVSGADWNPINSAKGREPNPISLASAASTLTPTPHVMPAQYDHLINQHPYGKTASATPPPPPNPSSSSASTSVSDATNTNTTSEKQWMTSKVLSFQTEISHLNFDKASLLQRINQLDQRLDDTTNEENALEEAKEREILEAVRQIEERYRERSELVRAQQRELGAARERELEGLRRNGADLKRRRTALEHFQALVGLYDEE